MAREVCRRKRDPGFQAKRNGWRIRLRWRIKMDKGVDRSFRTIP